MPLLSVVVELTGLVTVAPDTGPPDVPSVTVPLIVNVVGRGAAMIVNRAVPLTFWYVAVMSTVPGAMPVTTPEPVTEATVELDDCQLAWVVTTCVAAVDIVATALNWALDPTCSGVPVTVTEVTASVAAA